MRASLLLALPLAWLTLPHQARAEVELAAHGGYAREFDPSVRGDLGPYGVGLGGRGGALFHRFYFGAWFEGFFGTRQSAKGTGVSYDASSQAWFLGPEVGYDVHLGERFMLRPLLGFGLRRLTGHTAVNSLRINDASSNVYLVTGALGAVRLGRVFVGPELRCLLTPLDLPNAWAPMLSLVAGVRL